MSDALAWGRRIRLFTVVDTFTRQALAIGVDTSLPGVGILRVLERLAVERGHLVGSDGTGRQRRR